MRRRLREKYLQSLKRIAFIYQITRIILKNPDDYYDLYYLFNLYRCISYENSVLRIGH